MTTHAPTRPWEVLRLVGALGLVLVGYAAVCSTGGRAMEEWGTFTLVNIVIAVGLYAFVGTSGVLSFGHMTFVALGAYLTGLLIVPAATKAILYPDLVGVLQGTELPLITALGVSAGLALVLGYVIAIPITRLAGIAAGIATLGLLIIANAVLQNAGSLTGPSGTLTGVPVTTGLFDALLWAILALAIVAVLQASATGLRLRAARDDDLAARALGANVAGDRRRAMALSAAVSGVGGGLYATSVGSFTPDAFYFEFTFLIIAMIVVGGMSSLSGAVLGVLVVSAASEVLLRFESGQPVGPIEVATRPGLREIVLALVLIAVLVLRPSGFTAGRELSLRIRRPGPSATR